MCSFGATFGKQKIPISLIYNDMGIGVAVRMGLELCFASISMITYRVSCEGFMQYPGS